MEQPITTTSSGSTTPREGAVPPPIVADTGCCPRFSPERWRSRDVVFRDKPFLRTRVRSFLHMPIGVERAMRRSYARIEALGALPDEPLVLVDERSPWSADYYIALGRELPGTDTVRLTGAYHTEVFEGPYRNVGRWMEETRRRRLLGNGESGKIYAWYTTCPRCAKAYGENYVVLFAETAQASTNGQPH